MAQFELLTQANRNPKLAKGLSKGYLSFVLHLAPAKLSGFNVCPMATQGCMAACLNTAGRGGIAPGVGVLTHAAIASGARNTIQTARIRRTRFFFEDRPGFMATLVRDMRRAIKLAARHGLTPVFRLNGTSDIRWEREPYAGHRNVMEAFPDVQFYDYTKIANRRGLPANYALTFSLADGNDADAIKALESGMNVAAVFRNEATVARYIERGVWGYALRDGARGVAAPVVNGDETDLRFLDPRGVIVGLYAKGNARKDASGFVRD